MQIKQLAEVLPINYLENYLRTPCRMHARRRIQSVKFQEKKKSSERTESLVENEKKRIKTRKIKNYMGKGQQKLKCMYKKAN